MPSESGGLEQIPAVAVEIFEHCDRTVVLVFWFPDEVNSHFEHSVVVPPEIVRLQEQKHSSAGLIADEWLLFRCGGTGEEEIGARPPRLMTCV